MILREATEIKYLPNTISIIRIIGAVALLFQEPLSPWFFLTYTLCGISDFLDGYLARRAKLTSQFGATIDSIADAIFIGVVLIIFIPLLQIPLWILCWIGSIALVRIGSLVIGLIKYRTITFLHTYANKATGLALFCFPFLYNWLGLTVTASLLCSLASLSALEELMINILSQTLSRDIKSIFAKSE